MDAILAQRYGSFYFSNVLGFPNPMPERDEWGSCLLRFKGEYWEVHVEHLLDFHECMHKMDIINEDVLINMLRYSLEGKSRESCRSLPLSRISSLKEINVIFNSYYKGMYAVDSLYDECCEEFSLMHHFSRHKIHHLNYGQMHEETITHNEYFIEDIIYSLEIDARKLFPLYFHDNFVVLNVPKDIYAQDTYQ